MSRIGSFACPPILLYVAEFDDMKESVKTRGTSWLQSLQSVEKINQLPLMTSLVSPRDVL